MSKRNKLILSNSVKINYIRIFLLELRLVANGGLSGVVGGSCGRAVGVHDAGTRGVPERG